MDQDERIVKLAVGDKVRITAHVSDGLEGALWVGAQIGRLHLDPRTVEFGHELGTYDNFRPEVWLEGRVTAVTGPDAGARIKMMPNKIMPCEGSPA